MGWSRNIPKYSRLLEKASVTVVPRGGLWCPGENCGAQGSAGLGRQQV